MSKKIDNGGPAFPFADCDISNAAMRAQGMSLRDWFAGQALAGTIGNANWDAYPHETAAVAYMIADAMLKAREAQL